MGRIYALVTVKTNISLNLFLRKMVLVSSCLIALFLQAAVDLWLAVLEMEV